MADICVYIALLLFGYDIGFAKANKNERYFLNNESLNDRVCGINDRAVEEEAKSNLHCSVICSKSAECMDYFYSKGSSTCVTCGTNLLTNSNTVPAPGMVHYGVYRSCLDLKMAGATKNQVYNLHTPATYTPVQVYCDMTIEGGGWIVWQRRFDGSLSFKKTFAEYEAGFGDPHTEYWLGLKYLHEFLMTRPSEVYLQVGDWVDNSHYEWYDYFELSAGPDYKLNVTSFLSASYTRYSLGFQLADGRAFSTHDYNYDNCVKIRGGGGFWYDGCNILNANGVYGSRGAKGGKYLYNYSLWHNFKALKKTKLMIRERNSP